MINLKKIFSLKNKNSRGYSMLELLLASAVGGIVLAGAYASYTIVGQQQYRVSAMSEVQSAGMPTVRLIARDLRMAGRVAMDANLDPVFGIISTPITITDSGDACCDSIEIIYDKDSTERRRITYDIQARTNPDRNAMYMDIDLWDDASSSWTSDISDALVTDYVEDFQVEGSDLNSDGNPMIVDIALILRSKSSLSKSNLYERPDQIIGNYDFSFNDNIYRDEFTMTVNIKNLR